MLFLSRGCHTLDVCHSSSRLRRLMCGRSTTFPGMLDKRPCLLDLKTNYGRNPEKIISVGRSQTFRTSSSRAGLKAKLIGLFKFNPSLLCDAARFHDHIIINRFGGAHPTLHLFYWPPEC